MRKNLLITLVLCLSFLFAIPQDGYANVKELKQKIYKQRVKDLKLGKGQMGRKFIVAIPPNESSSFGWSDSAMEIYIASANDVELTLNILGSNKTKLLKAGDVFTIGETEGLTKTSSECREPNQVTKKTVTIEATKPVSVYVMNSKNTTSDGYMALPVDSWQNEYIHCSYYDNYESSTNTFAEGFLVIGSAKNTLVNVDLKGVGSSAIATIMGDESKSIGDQVTIKLNEGEVYQIEGDGLTRGVFDLSGSVITGSKPIGLISYHWRAVMPIFTSSSRDHLCAMPMPTATWGQQYASISLKRGGSIKGDMFRIVALEPNTTYTVDWYDLESKVSLGSKSGILHEKGEFNEISEVLKADASSRSITGTSIFRADKPIFVMQYSYSSAWDGAGYDPFMWPVTSVEQYITSTIVQAPSNKTFGENYINIVAWDDPTDPNKEGLKSLEFDEVKIIDKVPSFTTNKIPGTDLYWARFAISPGAHKMTGDGTGKFGGYIYGFKSVDSYGWPAAMALRNLSETDTVPPVVDLDGECGEWLVHVTELTVDPNEEADPRQVDSKVWSEPAVIIQDSTVDGIKYTSYNIDEPVYTNAKGTPLTWEFEPHEDYYFTLSVIDKFNDAKCYFYVADDEGNITIDSVEYFADYLTLVKPDSITFNRRQIMQDHFLDVTFKNAGNGTIELGEIKILDGEFFSIVPDVLDYGKTSLDADEEMTLQLQYSPTEEIEDAEDFDLDSISFEAACLDFKWPITGQGVTPKIKVEDWAIDYPVFPGNIVEKTDGITIENPGSAPLVVTAYRFEKNLPEFKYEPTGSVQFTIQPRMFNKNNPNAWKAVVTKETFAPTATGTFEDNLIFSSNAFDPAGGDDSISIWTAFSTMGNVMLTSYDFGKQHLQLKSDGTVTVSNTGTEAVMITKLAFIDPANTKTDNFKFVDIANNLVSENVLATPIQLEPKNDGDTDESTFNVAFVPRAEEELSVQIYAEYYTVTDVNQEKQQAINNLKGQGTLPNVNVTEATFQKTAPGVDVTLAERKSVFIKNIDEDEDLIVNSISIDPIYVNDFIPVEIDGVPYDVSLFPLSVPVEGEVEVVYAFAPPNVKPGLQIDPTDPTNGFVYFTNIIVNTNHIEGSGAPKFEMRYADFVQNDIDPTTDQGYLKGFVVEGDASIVGINYGMTMRCDNLPANVRLNNLSQSQVLVIDDIVITDDEEGVFVITDDVRNDIIGTQIPIGGSTTCEVIFDPHSVSKDLYEAAPNMELDFTAKVAMQYHFVGGTTKETDTKDLTASARLLNVDISQKIQTMKGVSEQEIPIQPGMFSYNTGGNVPHYTNYFIASIDDANEWDDLNITSLSISYRYKKEWMGLIKTDNPFALNTNPGFNVVKSGSVDDGEYVIDTYTVSTTGNAYLSYADKTAAMLNPYFLLYLSSDTKYMPEITDITFATRDECITYTASTEEIPLINCIQDINLISSTGGSNLAPTLSPNPVVTSSATITYGVALNAQASLKLYDESGKVVKVIFDDYQQAGTHTVNISTEDLPSGVYLMRLEQNTFTGEGNMVISK